MIYKGEKVVWFILLWVTGRGTWHQHLLSIEEALLTQQHCESDRCVFLPFAITGPPS